MHRLLLSVLLLYGASALADEYEGSLVVEVQGRSAAANAGIRAGDRILAWREPGSAGSSPAADWQPVRSPFDLLLVAHLLASSRSIAVQFEHETQSHEAALEPNSFGISAQPGAPEGMTLYREIDKLSGAEKVERLETFTRAYAGGPGAKAWLQVETGIAALGDKQVEAGQQWFEQAAATLAASGESTCEDFALLRLRAGEALREVGAYPAADVSLEQSIDAAKPCVNAEVLTAAAMSLRGLVAAYASEFDAAVRYAQAALEIQKAYAPLSLAVAESRHTLGNAAYWQGDTDLAEQHYSEALRIRSTVAKGGVQHGRSIATLGNVAWRRGDPETAENHFLEAYAIHAAAMPESLLAAGDLTMLGHVASDRKDFRRAEEYYFRSLAITEKNYPGEETVANTLMGLGNASRRQYKLDAARNYHTRAMEIYLALDAKQRLALVYNNLANVEFDDGLLEASEKLYQRSLELRTELGIKEAFNASVRYNLANVARLKGDSELGRRQLVDVLAEFRSSSPDSLAVQATVFTLGELEHTAGNSDAAEAYFTEALEIAERLAPGTLYEVEPLHRLGKLAASRNQPQQALDLYSRAVDSFESQRRLVGGNAETKTNFAAKFDYLYKDLAELLIESNEPAAAFDIVERYRSRVLMAMMLGRAQDVQRPVAAAVADEWSSVHQNYDAALNGMMRARSASPEKIVELRSQLDVARSERDVFVDRYRALDPARAAFEYPAAVPLAEAIDALPKSSTLLSYLVSERAVYAFVINTDVREALQLFKLNVGAEQLAKDIELFGDLIRIQSPNSTLEASQRQVSARLYSSLVQPLHSTLGEDRKLVILADGVLHSLPFSALITNGTNSDVPRYFIEERAIQYAPSLDWLLATRKRDTPQRDRKIAVFADPVVAAGETSALTRSGYDIPFAPLPGAREEAQSIAGLFESTQLFLGASATESNAKSVANTELAILHFATHGVVDIVRPMESFLLLGSDEGEPSANNGLLQASEVAEQMTLSNALIVLSACETSVGKLSAGEGVIGLSSAFLYAGARQVVSTLWAVSDTSTSRLMSEFYEHLNKGASPSDALRAAQLAAIAATREPDGFLASWRRGWQRFRGRSAGPSQNWAAFRLYGEFN